MEIILQIEEYTHLKDIETRFTILRDEMLKAAYCPIHHQIILGIEKEYQQMHGTPEKEKRESEIPAFLKKYGEKKA